MDANGAFSFGVVYHISRNVRKSIASQRMRTFEPHVRPMQIMTRSYPQEVSMIVIGHYHKILKRSFEAPWPETDIDFASHNSPFCLPHAYFSRELISLHANIPHVEESSTGAC